MMSTHRIPESTALPSTVERYARREFGRSPLDDAFVARLRDSHERGQRRARELALAHATTDPTALARAEGVAIVVDEWPGMATFTILGSYADRTITIYERQVREVAVPLPLTEGTVRDVIIAHELGHHALNDEFATKASNPLDRLFAVVAGAHTGHLRRARTVLVETAAHAFAGRLVDISPLAHPLEVTETEQRHSLE